MPPVNGNAWLVRSVLVAGVSVILGALTTAVWWDFLEIVAQGKQLAALSQQVQDMTRCRP